MVHVVGPINSQYVVLDEEQPRPHRCAASYLNYRTNRVTEALRWEHVHPALWIHMRFEAQSSSFNMPGRLPRLHCIFPVSSLPLRTIQSPEQELQTQESAYMDTIHKAAERLTV
jgi:hypothetical protein